MIEAQAGDNRHQRRQHVSGVEPPAEAHFDDGHVHRAGGEVVKGDGRDDLEPGNAGRRFNGRAHTAHNGDECLFADPPVGVVGRQNADALAEFAQMGRGVEADAQPGQPQAGSAHGRD